MKIVFENQKELAEYVAERSLGNIDTTEQCKTLLRAMVVKHGYHEIDVALEAVVMELKKARIPAKGVHRIRKTKTVEEE